MSKISELSDGGSLVSSDYLIAVRSGGNVKVRMDSINVDQVDLGDNEFIRLGNSQDLTMVHTPTQSIINQAGIGDLLIQKAGATKLTINATGIDVTGSVTADGATVSGQTIISADALVATPSTYYDELVVQNSASGTGAGMTILVNATNGFGGIKFGDSGNSNQFGIGFDASANLGFLDVLGGQALTIDSSRNVGIGVFPESHYTGYVGIDFGKSGGLFSNTSGTNLTGLSNNAYLNSDASAWVYKETDEASYYNQTAGTHRFSVAPSGTAGTSITWSEAMRIDASGNVGIGVVPSVWRSNEASIDIGRYSTSTSVGNYSNGGSLFAYNTFISTAGQFTRKATGFSTTYNTYNGVHEWTSDASAAAGAFTPTPRMRLDASGNFIVGATSAFDSSSFCVDQSGFGQFRRDGTPLIVRRDGSFGDLIPFEKDGATIGGISVVDSDPTGGGGELLVASGNTGLKFDDQVNYIRPANAAGGGRDNIIDLGNSSNRFKDLYLSGGVYLGGTGAANKLDDYEEGTWTPEIYYQNATDQGNATNTTQTGYYTKIGRVVTVDFRLIWNITGSPASDNIGVKNLPFAGGGDTFSAAGVAYPINNSTTIPTLLLTRPSDGGTLLLCQDGEVTSNLGNEFGSGSAKEIRGTVTYFTDA